MSQNLKLSAQGSWITVDYRYTFKVEGYVVHKGDSAIPVEERKAAARRIVACVNACEGVPTDVLENSTSAYGALTYQQTLRKWAEAQRDELLAALEGADKAITAALPHLPADGEAVFCGEWLSEIREAIARVKGGAA